MCGMYEVYVWCVVCGVYVRCVYVCVVLLNKVRLLLN